MQRPTTQQSRSVQLESITLTNGLTTTRKLSSSGAWTKLRFRLAGTNTNTTGTGLSRYEGLGVLSRLRLKAGGRPVFDLTPGEIYKQQQFLSGTRPERVAASLTTGAFSYSFEVSFILPKPFTYPRNGITAFPAGILPNIELEVVCPPDLAAGIETTVGDGVVSGCSLTVTAEIMDIPNAVLAKMVRENKLHGYLQQELSDQPSATGTRDVQLVAGEGVMIGLYASNAMATVPLFSNTMAGEVNVILGSNDFVTQSRFLELNNRARELFGAADPVINTGFNTAGSIFIPYAPNGALGEGIDLNGQQSLKYRQSIDTLTNNVGRVEVIQHILLAGYWRTVALTGIQ